MRPIAWMFGSEVDRERLLDMEHRLRPIRRKTFLVLGAGLVACAPWAGWWTLAPMTLAVAVYWLIERVVGRVNNPAILFFGGWLLVEAIIATSVALSGNLREVTVCLLVIPAMTLNARFSKRVIVVGVGLVVVSIAGALLATGPQLVLREPPVLVAPIMLVVAWAMLSIPLMESDIDHRKGSRVDPLTGMLNRNALDSRIADLAQQSEITRAPVGVIQIDIDHFKAVNDQHGHAAGDAVLKDIAYLLRKHRAYESAFRYGGEEFLFLVPGADLGDTRALAEALRCAIERTRLGDGYCVTISLGVAASCEGERFNFDEVFARADAALYEAKRTGRNRVCVAAAAETTPARLRLAIPAEAV